MEVRNMKKEKMGFYELSDSELQDVNGGAAPAIPVKTVPQIRADIPKSSKTLYDRLKNFGFLFD